MTCFSIKYKKSKYKHIAGDVKGNIVKWYVNIRGCSGRRYDTEIQAAKEADFFLIKIGKEPVNILKKKC